MDRVIQKDHTYAPEILFDLLSEQVLFDSQNQDTNRAINYKPEIYEYIAYLVKESTGGDKILDWDEITIESAFSKHQLTDQKNSTVLFVKHHSLVPLHNIKEHSTFIWQGAYIDTGAERTSIGLNKAKAHYNFVGVPFRPRKMKINFVLVQIDNPLLATSQS